MRERLQEILDKFDAIEAQLQDPEVVMDHNELERLGRARAELADIVDVVREYLKAQRELEESKALIDDHDMREMALLEIESLTPRISEYEETLKRMLLPKDSNDEKNVIMEIRAAAGGDEAALFAAELFRLYTRYAERRGWKVEVSDVEEIGIGGMSRVVFTIAGAGAYSQLKHESGVHRVQRVPATESQGRIHTSTATVAVLPEVEERDVEINEKDLEISTFRSSSAGGQHMQKNETAIRIVHKPSGIVVTCQDERSQQQNKLRGLAVLRAKLYEAEQERQAKEQGALRKGQIGSGDRSEKIRTYHFPQDRVTDHRIGLSLHSILLYMDGDIQRMIDALIQEEQTRLLLQSGNDS
ncbi:MAG: peptide chain release factor 1 [Fimbriimonadaceae bacterium]|nr:peptide chain release factor 1 [Fimbriimonadaceae bacterium]